MTETVIVGSENCRICDIATALKVEAIVVKEWRELARTLGVNGAEIEKLMQDMQAKKLTLSDIIQHILEDWKSRTGSEATLVQLMGHMEEVKWFHILELLAKCYGIPYVRNQSINTTKPLPKKFAVEDPVDTFTGRGVELEALDEQLARLNTTNLDRDNTLRNGKAAICGLGGIGKTELARQYIYLYGGHFNYILWIDAKTESSIQQSFTSIATDELSISLKDKDSGEKSIFTIVRQVYRELEGSLTLVVFDNATVVPNFKKYLPNYQQGYLGASILVTSRDREWDLKFKMKIICIHGLTMEEAIELVKRGLMIGKNYNSDEIKRLLKLLQCFPLAIQQAVSYIKQRVAVDSTYGITKYTNEFIKSKAELLNSEIHPGYNTYTESTFTAWNLTMNSIENDKEYGNLAARIFYIMAYMASDAISLKFFTHMIETVQVQPNLRETLKGILHSFIYMGANTNPTVHKVTEDKIKRAIRLLVKYSMVKRISENEDSVSVDRLVQEVTLMKLRQNERESVVLQEALELLSQADNNTLSTHGPIIWKSAEKHTQLLQAHNRIPVKIAKALHVYGEE